MISTAPGLKALCASAKTDLAICSNLLLELRHFSRRRRTNNGGRSKFRTTLPYPFALTGFFPVQPFHVDYPIMLCCEGLLDQRATGAGVPCREHSTEQELRPPTRFNWDASLPARDSRAAGKAIVGRNIRRLRKQKGLDPRGTGVRGGDRLDLYRRYRTRKAQLQHDGHGEDRGSPVGAVTEIVHWVGPHSLGCDTREVAIAVPTLGRDAKSQPASS